MKTKTINKIPAIIAAVAMLFGFLNFTAFSGLMRASAGVIYFDTDISYDFTYAAHGNDFSEVAWGPSWVNTAAGVLNMNAYGTVRWNRRLRSTDDFHISFTYDSPGNVNFRLGIFSNGVDSWDNGGAQQGYMLNSGGQFLGLLRPGNTFPEYTGEQVIHYSAVAGDVSITGGRIDIVVYDGRLGIGINGTVWYEDDFRQNTPADGYLQMSFRPTVAYTTISSFSAGMLTDNPFPLTPGFFNGGGNNGLQSIDLDFSQNQDTHFGGGLHSNWSTDTINQRLTPDASWAATHWTTRLSPTNNFRLSFEYHAPSIGNGQIVVGLFAQPESFVPGYRFGNWGVDGISGSLLFGPNHDLGNPATQISGPANNLNLHRGERLVDITVYDGYMVIRIDGEYWYGSYESPSALASDTQSGYFMFQTESVNTYISSFSLTVLTDDPFDTGNGGDDDCDYCPPGDCDCIIYDFRTDADIADFIEENTGTGGLSVVNNRFRLGQWNIVRWNEQIRTDSNFRLTVEYQVPSGNQQLTFGIFQQAGRQYSESGYFLHSDAWGVGTPGRLRAPGGAPGTGLTLTNGTAESSVILRTASSRIDILVYNGRMAILFDNDLWYRNRAEGYAAQHQILAQAITPGYFRIGSGNLPIYIDTFRLTNLIADPFYGDAFIPDLCIDCGEYPCVCVCDDCGENPCVCPCDECGEFPCVCIPANRFIENINFDFATGSNDAFISRYGNFNVDNAQERLTLNYPSPWSRVRWDVLFATTDNFRITVEYTAGSEMSFFSIGMFYTETCHGSYHDTALGYRIISAPSPSALNTLRAPGQTADLPLANNNFFWARGTHTIEIIVFNGRMAILNNGNLWYGNRAQGYAAQRRLHTVTPSFGYFEIQTGQQATHITALSAVMLTADPFMGDAFDPGNIDWGDQGAAECPECEEDPCICVRDDNNYQNIGKPEGPTVNIPGLSGGCGSANVGLFAAITALFSLVFVFMLRRKK